MTVRFSPSLVSNERCLSRPVTMTREPRVSDSATFSAAWRHTLQRRNSASPSFHSWDCRSKVRGVEATVKLATAAPDLRLVGAPGLRDHGQEPVERGSDGAFLEIGVEDDHQFVVTHEEPHLLWSVAAAVDLRQEGRTRVARPGE